MKTLIAANFSTQFFSHSLVEEAKKKNFQIDKVEANYDSIVQSLFTVDFESEGIHHAVILFEPQNLEHLFFSENPANRTTFANEQFDSLRSAVNHARGNGLKQLYISNLSRTATSIHGSNAPLNPNSFDFQVIQWNDLLYDFIRETPSLTLLDIEKETLKAGISLAFDHKLRTLSDHPWSMEFTAQCAKYCIHIMSADSGAIEKCLILDLDNTTWGGVIGDDGLKGISIGKEGIAKRFRELQLWARELKRRGIILCICSKNTEAIAKEPFLAHPEMILKLEDIAVFVANWQNKADNIKHIQKILNIGFESMVFLDDNPAERAIVKENIPSIIVPELPEAPEEYLPALSAKTLFASKSKGLETSIVDRTKHYQVEAERAIAKESSVSLTDFIRKLEMKAEVTPFVAEDFPRIVELFQRSNQFNLTTIRYGELEIHELLESSSVITRSFKLSDRFGEHGLVSLIVLKNQKPQLIVESWVMSCRVLNRTLEQFIASEILRIAEDLECTEVIGLYRPTPKNKLVENLYPSLGFQSREDKGFILPIDNKIKLEHYIHLK